MLILRPHVCESIPYDWRSAVFLTVYIYIYIYILYFYKYWYRIESGKKISIYRYFHVIAQKEQQQNNIKTTHKSWNCHLKYDSTTRRGMWGWGAKNLTKSVRLGEKKWECKGESEKHQESLRLYYLIIPKKKKYQGSQSNYRYFNGNIDTNLIISKNIDISI